MEPEKRRYSRCDFSQIIEYSFPPQFTDDVLTGLLNDFSYSGICVITHHPLKEGQEIMIKSIVTSDSINAVVRWCIDMGNTNYKVGLELKK